MQYICFCENNYNKKKNMAKKQSLNEVNVNGSRVYVENGKVKTQLSEAIQNSGYMSVEDSRKITLEAVKKIYELNGNV